MLRSLEAVFNRVTGFFFYVACILIGFSMLSVDGEIVYRLLTGKAHLWVVEISEYILLIMTFFGATWVLKKEGHVVLDIAVTLFKPRNRAVINAITSLVGAIICLVIFWHGLTSAWEHFTLGSTMIEKALELPTAPLLAILPVGFFLFSIQFLRRAHKYLRRWRVPSEEEEEEQLEDG